MTTTPWRIVITRWGLDSYLNLRNEGVFNAALYRKVLRPDILLLRGMTDPKFKNPKFWGPAIDRKNCNIVDGYKMKWHNFGNGSIQLRLCVALIDDTAYLCHAYKKTSPAHDKRRAGTLKDKILIIRQGNHEERGEL